MSELHIPKIIVAYDRHHAIGTKNMIPWLGALPADMKHFREKTLHQSVLMGRRTYDSLHNGPLLDRENIVLTRDTRLRIPGVRVVNSMEEVLHTDIKGEELYVIGGGEIYRQAYSEADVMYVTEVDTEMENPDTYFPDFAGSDWQETQREAHEADDRNKYNYSFVTYERT